MYFAFYQHYIYITLFYLTFIFTILYALSFSQISNSQSNTLNYILFSLVILFVIYLYIEASYGLNRVVPKEDMKLESGGIIVPKTSIMTKTIDSGRGYSLYLEFYPVLHSTNYIYRITSKNQQYYLGYEPNSGDLLIKVKASNEDGMGTLFDNVFKIENLPMQRKNRLLMNVNQDIVTIYLNDTQYSFKMTGIPRIVTSNIYVGQNNGLRGTISRYMYLDFPLSNIQSKRLMRSMILKNRYLLGFIPVM